VPKISAGLLLYRRHGNDLQVLLVHPGGPFWAKKDLGAWSLPKGEADACDDLLGVALRELHEETGLNVEGPFTALTPVKQSGGKVVHAWAAPYDGDVQAIVSNTFRLEWPPRSGRVSEFPEVDKAEWFDRATANEKILQSQRPLLDEFFAGHGEAST
jgi:predicted NUDIX family NTP pyrophosphohydrolase